jgi:hypothetical protein
VEQKLLKNNKRRQNRLAISPSCSLGNLPSGNQIKKKNKNKNKQKQKKKKKRQIPFYHDAVVDEYTK